MKKILTVVVTLSILIFALSGCGVFKTPDLGKEYKAKGPATIETAFAPLVVKAYEIDIDLQFGGIWDPNKVKAGTVKFNNVAVVSDDRAEITPPTYTVVDGYYSPATRILELKCQENANSSKITVKGRVTTDYQQIEEGFIYKTHNSTDLSNNIGYFDANKQ